MIRIGILGAAKIAPSALIEPAKKRTDCKIVCLAARDPARARAFADAHGIADTADNYDALIARPDIDLIYNALPPHRHADLTIAALDAGKAVLCEKPFAMNAAQARAMTDAADRNGRPLIEAFHYRFHPMFKDILTQVRAGSIGEVCAIRSEFSVAIPDRPGELRHDPALGGGALMDLGCYAVHWARTVMGFEPRVADAECKLNARGADLITSARLQFEGDVSALIRTSMAPGQKFKALLAIQGTRGTLVATNPLAPHRGHSVNLRRGLVSSRYTLHGDTTYDHQLAHVMDVMTGKAAPLTGYRDAVANMDLIDAIYSKARIARPVA